MSKFTQHWGVLTMCVLLASSCQKAILEEPQFNEQSLRASQSNAPSTKPFKLTAKTWYRINPATSTVVPGMPGQVALANMPGQGSGKASNMGNIGTWFNQLAFSPNGQYPETGVTAAPLADIPSYMSSVSRGAPLPAIQPEDFRSYPNLMNWLNVPATVDGDVVWSVVYNGSGDAVFLAYTGGCAAVKESDTRITYHGEGKFVGGRGKYENASGTYQITGFFNPQDANDAGYSIDGDISF